MEQALAANLKATINGIEYTENEILAWIDRYNRAEKAINAIYDSREDLEAIEAEAEKRSR